VSFGLMMGIFDPLLNWIRSFSQLTKGIILLVALMLSLLCLAKCINVGKNHTERPIKWVMFGLCVLFMGIAILVGIV